MATQGPFLPSTAADVTGIGTIVWTNPTNIFTDNGIFATALFSGSDTSHWLRATNFGFTIPAGATIDGHTVEWDRKTSIASTLKDAGIRIVKGLTIGATDKSNVANWPTTSTFQSYGGASDLWGETWATSDTNSTGYGAALSCVDNPQTGVTGSVDVCKITIDYTPGSSTLLERSYPRGNLRGVMRGVA